MNDDDLNKKIQQIAEMLGQENMPDNVKGLLSALAGSFSGSEEAREKPQPATQKKIDDNMEFKENTEHMVSSGSLDQIGRAEAAEGAEGAELLMRAKKLMDKLGTGNDPRVALLHAIKPFMGSKRQQKISNCIKILQLASMTKLIDFNDK